MDERLGPSGARGWPGAGDVPANVTRPQGRGRPRRRPREKHRPPTTLRGRPQQLARGPVLLTV